MAPYGHSSDAQAGLQDTYRNEKIYVGSDTTGSVTYFGSPSAKQSIAADLGEQVNDYVARKTILCETDSATKAEVLAMERKFIVETGANNPAVGYNLTPKYTRPTRRG